MSSSIRLGTMTNMNEGRIRIVYNTPGGNDEKVALSETPPTQHAYLYLFQRIDSIGSLNPSY
eukprot:scaffold1335_cov282-Chaetoceros_neogracile.AAC.3